MTQDTNTASGAAEPNLHTIQAKLIAAQNCHPNAVQILIGEALNAIDTVARAALASTPGAARSTAPDWDEVFDCAVAAYNTEIFSKDNLRWCFQSRTQKIERTCNWTANELMAFALGIAALYAPQFSEKRDATDD